MKSKKSNIKLATKHKSFFILATMLLITMSVVTAVLINRINFAAEANLYSNLSTELESLSAKFNSVDSGWTTDTYCEGFGSDITRSNKKRCFASINNVGDTSGNIKDNYQVYKSTIENTGKFTKIRDTVTVNSIITDYESKRITEYRYTDANISCDLSDSDYSESGTIGISFRCSGSTKSFHYGQR